MDDPKTLFIIDNIVSMGKCVSSCLWLSSKEIRANKPICKLGTICFLALDVLPLALFDLTCFLMSNFWVARENDCSFETTAGVSNEWRVKVLGKGPRSRGREWGEGRRQSWNHSQEGRDWEACAVDTLQGRKPFTGIKMELGGKQDGYL